MESLTINQGLDGLTHYHVNHLYLHIERRKEEQRRQDQSLAHQHPMPDLNNFSPPFFTNIGLVYCHVTF